MCASADSRSSALYQFTMRGDNLQDLTTFGPRMLARAAPAFRRSADVNTDQQNNGLQSIVQYDRRTASRFGISPQLIDNTLYDAFGQRQVSTMYTGLNQYHVVMEAAPQYLEDPQFLREIYVRSPSGQQVPLSAFAHYAPTTAPLAVNHQGLFPAVTISFNLAPGVALGDAVDAIEEAASQSRASSYHPHDLRRNGAGLSGFAGQPAGADRRRAGGRLHRARHSLRELYSSDHDSLHAALGRRGRAAGAADSPHRSQHHRHDRHHSADRHREEERHHDDRFRAGDRTQRAARTRAMPSTRPACCASGRSS